MNAKSIYGRSGRGSDTRREREVDLGLAVMECITPPGHEVPFAAINAACGLSHCGANLICRAALRKLQFKLRRMREDLTT